MSGCFKVFVVDDDPATLDIMRSLLESEYAVETFASVEECQSRLTDEKPGMFLLDVNLPGMNGYDFCRQLKDEHSFRQIPVTFVSSNDTSEARLAGYARPPRAGCRCECPCGAAPLARTASRTGHRRARIRGSAATG